jgi:hypothetical protein
MLALEQIQAAIVDVCVFSAIRPHAFTEPVFLCFDNLMQDFFQKKQLSLMRSLLLNKF